MLIHKTTKFTLKETDDTSRVIKGYASIFGNLDSDNDVIKKGAFNKSIKEWGPDGKDRIKMVAQHDISRPIAKMMVIKEDDKGLYVEAKFGSHTDGEDYYRMAKEGLVNEFSVGFVPVEKEENEKGGYDISSIKLYEVSMVTVAANDKAVVTDVKRSNPLKLVAKIKDEELKHKLEHEILILMSEKDTTLTEAKGTSEASSEQVVEKDDLITNLLKLY